MVALRVRVRHSDHFGFGKVLRDKQGRAAPTAAEVEHIVATYAGNENDHQQQMYRDSLHAALTVAEEGDLLEAAGFDVVNELSHRSIAEAQRKTAGLRDRLRTYVYARFIILAEKPRVGP